MPKRQKEVRFNPSTKNPSATESVEAIGASSASKPPQDLPKRLNNLLKAYQEEPEANTPPTNTVTSAPPHFRSKNPLAKLLNPTAKTKDEAKLLNPTAKTKDEAKPSNPEARSEENGTKPKSSPFDRRGREIFTSLPWGRKKSPTKPPIIIFPPIKQLGQQLLNLQRGRIILTEQQYRKPNLRFHKNNYRIKQDYCKF